MIYEGISILINSQGIFCGGISIYKWEADHWFAQNEHPYIYWIDSYGHISVYDLKKGSSKYYTQPNGYPLQLPRQINGFFKGDALQ